jgi:hypothetical protein
MPVGCSTALPPPCRQYQVKVRLTGGAAGACPPQLSLPDGGQGFVSLPDPTNPCRSRQLRVGVCGKDANTVCLDLGLARTLESPCGGLTAVGRCVIEKSQTVKLGEKAQVALNDGVNDAEPYSAEVTVREGPCGEGAVLANAMGAPAPLCCPPPPPVVLGGPAPGWAPPCVPYCPPPMPYHGGDVMPMPTTAPQVVPCALTAPPPCGKRVCLIREGGKSRLQMKAEDGTCASCLRLALEAPASGRMRLAAGKKQVHVAGRMWKARADQVELLADGRVILGGKVRVVSDKAGVCAVLKGQRIVLRVQDGHVKDVMGGIFE